MRVSLGVTDFKSMVTVGLITRGADSYDSNGNGVKGAENALQLIKVDLQPVNERDLKDLKEGLREEASHTLWTNSEINLDDKIIYDSETYRVIKLWGRPEDDFTKALIGKKDD